MRIRVIIEYQVVAGKGAFHGQLDLSRPDPIGTQSTVPLESHDHARAIAQYFVPDAATKAEKRAEDGGEPIVVFDMTFSAV